MSAAIAAAVGALIGLAAHDLAAQSLDDQPLRPWRGVCPTCATHRGWHRIECRSCHRRLSRELVIAALSAAAGAGIFLAIGPTWLLLPYAGFLLLAAAVGITDIDAMRIVDRLNLRGSAIAIVILGAVAVLGGGVDDFLRSLGGGVAYFLGALLLFIIGRGNGFGAGDVKLAPLLGVFTTYLGWVVLGRAVLATAFIGGLLAVGALLFSEAKRDTELPYGPAMILGAWLAIFLFGISAI